MKKLITTLFILLLSILVIGQTSISEGKEKINTIDENNKKQGLWKLYGENQELRMSCYYVDNQIKEFIQYFKGGKLVFQIDSPIKKERLWKLMIRGRTINGTTKQIDGSTVYFLSNGKQVDPMLRLVILKITKIPPIYYGGQGELDEYLGKYKQSDCPNASIKFMLDRNGYTTDISIADCSNNKSADSYLKLSKKMPRWQPAHAMGKMINYSMEVPIFFPTK